MNMILLHGKGSNKKIYLNADFIEAIQSNGDETMIAIIAYNSGFYTVRETPEEIIQMIRGVE